jgi:hypothetical protein
MGGMFKAKLFLFSGRAYKPQVKDLVPRVLLL